MAHLADITTPRLRIAPFEERHLTDRYIGWLNDPEVVKFSEQRHRRHDRQSCRAYYETMRASGDYFCAIERSRGEPEHVGNVSVYVDRPNGLADIAILIGERAMWGSGVGYEAWTAVLRALLEREGFRKVTGGAVATNAAMIRIMEKAGMLPDGRRPGHYLVDGKPVDLVHYAVVAANSPGQR